MDDVQSLVGMRMLARMRYLEDKGAAWACKLLKDLSIIGGGVGVGGGGEYALCCSW